MRGCDLCGKRNISLLRVGRELVRRPYIDTIMATRRKNGYRGQFRIMMCKLCRWKLGIKRWGPVSEPA